MSAHSKVVIERDVIHWGESGGSSHGSKPSKKVKKDKKHEPWKPCLQLDEPLLPQFFPKNDKNDFVRDYFQKNVVVSRDFDLSQVSNTLFDLDPKKMLSETASDQIHVWLKSFSKSTNGKEDDTVQVLDSITVEDPEQALKLYQAGHSLYCRASAEFESLVVMKLANELQYGIRNVLHNDRFRRGEVEMFFSRANHYTDFHSDFQENFTLQLSGSKRWIFQESKAVHPIRGCTPHFNLSGSNSDVVEQQIKVLRLGNPSFSSVDFRASSEDRPHTSVVLHPGDIMYHPAGVWHRVECLEDSISINISLTAVSYADIFCSSLQQILLENPRWRSAVFPSRLSQSSHKEDALSVMKSLLSAVPTMVSSMSAADFLPAPMLHEHLPHSTEESESMGKQTDEAEEDEEDVDDESGSVNSDEISEDAMEEDLDDLEEVGSDNDDNDEFVEVKEGDSDDEDEENSGRGKRLKIVVADVLIAETREIAISSLSSSPVSIETEKESNGTSLPKKRKASDHDEPRLRFRFNPAALLITDQDLTLLSTSSDDGFRKYVINIGFGNETLESACRAELIVASPYQGWMDTIIRRYQEFSEAKYAALIRFNQSHSNVLPSSVWISSSFSAEDILGDRAGKATVKKAKVAKNDVVKSNAAYASEMLECERLLLGLFQAGLLTPVTV
jgi:ribosomal protein L16 Arg81 hydroxylase